MHFECDAAAVGGVEALLVWADLAAGTGLGLDECISAAETQSDSQRWQAMGSWTVQ